MAVFSEDPFPCLELATVYDEKNAYRKAEQVLAEALNQFDFDILRRFPPSLADFADFFEGDEEGPDFETDILPWR